MTSELARDGSAPGVVEPQDRCSHGTTGEPPLLLMGLGYVESVTHYYIRPGITTLFATLHVATAGEGMTQRKLRHRRQEFLGLAASLCVV
jgi:hypothetical protein